MISDQVFMKIAPGLQQYNHIMEAVQTVDVSKDKEFQRMFNGFYRMRQRSQSFYTYYFSLMEQLKNKVVNFEIIYRNIYENTGRIEASFSSKMLATLWPEKPIWDKYVLANLNIKVPYSTDKNRFEKNIQLYEEINNWYDNYLQSELAKECITEFDKWYPNSMITKTKKIDFILWQSR